MNDKEKLVELLTEFYGCDPMYYGDDALAIAHYLVDRGVTVPQWISVNDRLPEEDKDYLVITNDFGSRQGVDIRWFAKDGETVDEYELAGQKCLWYFYDSEYGYVSTNSVTHWMPLPEPPKEE